MVITEFHSLVYLGEAQAPHTPEHKEQGDKSLHQGRCACAGTHGGDVTLPGRRSAVPTQDGTFSAVPAGLVTDHREPRCGRQCLYYQGFDGQAFRPVLHRKEALNYAGSSTKMFKGADTRL